MVKGKLKFILKNDNGEIDWQSIAVEIGISDSSDNYHIGSKLLKSIVSTVLGRHKNLIALVDHKAPTSERQQSTKNWVYLAE